MLNLPVILHPGKHTNIFGNTAIYTLRITGTTRPTVAVRYNSFDKSARALETSVRFSGDCGGETAGWAAETWW